MRIGYYHVFSPFQYLGALPRTLLRKLLKKFSKDFQNFYPIGFWVLFLRGTDFGVAVCRATISGCSEPHSASEMRTAACRLSPLPDRNGRKRPRGAAPNPA